MQLMPQQMGSNSSKLGSQLRQWKSRLLQPQETGAMQPMWQLHVATAPRGTGLIQGLPCQHHQNTQTILDHHMLHAVQQGRCQ
jgi:hypothetical protein